MAIAGPAASVALGLAAAAAAIAMSAALYPVDLATGPFLARLAWLNLLLAAFNMIPAFPLDGGRVFRSLLEQRLDLERATRIAGTTGRWFAFVLIAAGMLANIWFAIIGVFVYLGASSEETATLAHLRLAGRRVRDVMLAPPTIIDASVSAAELRQLVRRNVQGVFPVASAGRYVGVVDVATIERAPDDARAGDLADSSSPTVAPDDELEGDLAALYGVQGHAVAVTDQGRIVGLLRLAEVGQLVAAPGSDTSGVVAE
jgi:CBS domain-containing protein